MSNNLSYIPLGSPKEQFLSAFTRTNIAISRIIINGTYDGDNLILDTFDSNNTIIVTGFTQTLLTGVTKGQIYSILGYVPLSTVSGDTRYYLASNPNHYLTSVTQNQIQNALGFLPSSSVTVNFNTVITALGYIPLSGNTVQPGTYNTLLIDSKGLVVSGTNINYSQGGITGLTYSSVTSALGYIPYNSTNPNNYISTITFNGIVNTLGYTPLSGNTTQPGTFNNLLIDSKGLVVSGSVINYLTSFTQSLQSSIFSGDIQGSGTTAVTLTLNTIISAGSVGSSTQIPIITFDSKGRLTLVSSVTVASSAGSSGITSINNQINAFQTLITGSTGLDFQILSTGGVHQFNIPTASSGSTRGLLSVIDWNIFNAKQNALGYTPLSGNTVQPGTYNTILVDSKGLVVSGSVINYLPLVVSNEIIISGNGISSSFTVTHNLNNEYHSVTVKNVATGRIIYPDIIPDLLSDTLSWSVAPLINTSFKITIIGNKKYSSFSSDSSTITSDSLLLSS